MVAEGQLHQRKPIAWLGVLSEALGPYNLEAAPTQCAQAHVECQEGAKDVSKDAARGRP